MNAKQLELLNHVIDSLEHPRKSMYKGWDLTVAQEALAHTLREIKTIEQYEHAMRSIG